MAYKAIPLETRSCKGCGVEFQTTDPRKWFHKRGCGRAKFVKQTNAWLLANRPNFPTEPCLACGAPVVQYRKRRYDAEMRYCGRSCQPRWHSTFHGPIKSELLASKSWLGECRWCGKVMASGSQSCNACSDKRLLVIKKIRTRIKWLLPKQCVNCGRMFNRFDQGSSCDECKRAIDRQSRILRRLRKKANGVYDSGIDYKVLFEQANGQCAICRMACDNPSVWIGWDGKTWMPNAPTLDHIIPLARGGTHTWGNVQLACASCNSSKADTVP